jgi:hypothetical protein
MIAVVSSLPRLILHRCRYQRFSLAGRVPNSLLYCLLTNIVLPVMEIVAATSAPLFLKRFVRYICIDVFDVYIELVVDLFHCLVLVVFGGVPSFRGALLFVFLGIRFGETCCVKRASLLVPLRFILAGTVADLKTWVTSLVVGAPMALTPLGQ